MDPKAILREYYGYESFRPGQDRMVQAILEGRDAMGIMPTGAGKSICFQVPAMLLPGVTIVVSPLISLMIDQVTALVQNGIPAAYLNSALTPGQYRTALKYAAQGRYKLIYVAPERLMTDEFLQLTTQIEISMITVDEAHCISQWGQDFRPSYRRICDLLEHLPKRPILSAFTATATKEVRDDILAQLKLVEPELVVTGFDRPNLYFAVKKPNSKLVEIDRYLSGHPEDSGIIYCSTRKNVEKVCDYLNNKGYRATRYHAGLEEEERVKNQEEFLYDRRNIMVATNAFGMGIDKSNVTFVIHYNMPKNMESYYQEAGRAGRDGAEAECILLYNGQDVVLNQFLIDQDNGNEDLTEEEKILIKEKDQRLLKQMTFYCHTQYCLRQYILRYFGENVYEPCGKCSVCRGEKETSISIPKPIMPPPAAKTKRTESKAKPTVELKAGPLDETLYKHLRRVRNQLAKEYQLPSYVIFADATLKDMSSKMPITRDEMLQVSGVGRVKLDKYGDAFIEAIRQYLKEIPE